MEDKRKRFVDEHIKPVTNNKKILNAFYKTPRENFIPDEARKHAYEDRALPIGEGQTISQPSLVALMTEALNLQGDEKVLEIGTGSGFQAAILAHLTKHVYSIEIVEVLAKRAKQTLNTLNIKNVHVFHANGTIGLPTHAPFDAIIITAGARDIPKPLIKQLKDGGIIVIPQGESLESLKLKVVKKKGKEIKIETREAVQFVPLIGKHASFRKS